MPEEFYGNAAFIMVFLGTMAKGNEIWTDVLAVWTTRGHAVALVGLCASVVTLGVLVALVISELLPLPLPEIRLTFGTLLLLFGMRWLRKAILRYTGAIAKRDEKAVFQTITKILKRPRDSVSTGFDWFGALHAFRSAFLNGLQIIFILIALASAGHALREASLGAVLASAMVIVLGLCFRRPLIEIPGNRLKFSVGVLLSAFGTFWTAEGLGFSWPASHLTILIIALAFWSVGWVAVLRGDADQKYATIIPFKTPIP